MTLAAAMSRVGGERVNLHQSRLAQPDGFLTR